jgi:cellulose synthase/poly-beta-1,6-N-acetylglucosamine synthase-like glycosyltransferase/peptidoglycan/xylan/chitin deacetylase (PgdA/CDA1 family)
VPWSGLKWFLTATAVIAALLVVAAPAAVHLAADHDDSGPPAAAETPVLTNEGGPAFRGDPAADRRVPIGSGAVALTFDDGPDPRWTPAILDALARHDVSATFFVAGTAALKHPDLLRRIVAEGHEVGNHTFSHPAMGSLPGWKQDAQIAFTQRAIVAATGRRPVTYRPPYSAAPDSLSAVELSAATRAHGRGLAVVLATHSTDDWRASADVESITANALRGGGTEPRVIVMHDGGNGRGATVEALDSIIPRLQERGYRFHTASEMAGLGADAMGHASALERIASRVFAGVAGLAVDPPAVAALMGVLMLAFAALLLARSAAALVLGVVHRRRRKWSDDHPVPGVSVIVPAYNEEAGIEASVRSLAQSDLDDVEVIVVDDGSTDDTARRVVDLDLPGVRLIRQVNSGKAAALNRGIEAASHEIVVLVDGDSVMAPDALRLLVRPFADDRVGAVAGSVGVANPSGLIGRLQQLEYAYGCVMERRMLDVIRAIGIIPGAAGAFRKTALADVGGVPRETITEDADLTMLIGAAGWEVTLAADARAFTEVPETWRALWKQRYRWTFGILQTLWKHRLAPVTGDHARRASRLTAPYLILFGPVSFIFGPLIDIYLVFVLLSGNFSALWLLGVAYGLALVHHVLALKWQHDSMWLAALLPVQHLVMRIFNYGVYYVSLRDLVLGRSPEWRKLERRGIDLAVVRQKTGA